jgi:hypothetical protein
VDNGLDGFTCAGPVLSHYELEVIGEPRGLNNEEWQLILQSTSHPTFRQSRIEGLKPPVWTELLGAGAVTTLEGIEAPG